MTQRNMENGSAWYHELEAAQEHQECGVDSFSGAAPDFWAEHCIPSETSGSGPEEMNVAEGGEIFGDGAIAPDLGHSTEPADLGGNLVAPGGGLGREPGGNISLTSFPCNLPLRVHMSQQQAVPVVRCLFAFPRHLCMKPTPLEANSTASIRHMPSKGKL